MNKLKAILTFYTDGFKTMGWLGKFLWIIILVKLFVIFFVLKIFFFPDFLKSKFDSQDDRSRYVIDNLTKTDN